MPAIIWAAVCVAFGPVSAEEFLDADIRFILDVVPGETLNYRIPFEVERTGELRIDADWPEYRVLSFRLDPPAGTMPAIRRSGPPPQSLSADVTGDATGRWVLSVHALAAKGGGAGRLGIRLPKPDQPSDDPQDVAATGIGNDDTTFPDPQSFPLPWQPFVRGASELAGLVAEGSLPDACRWQQPFVDWTSTWAETLADEGRTPPEETSRTLRRMAEVIRSVDALLDPDDPVLVDPPANDPAKLEDWLQRRSLRLESVQDGLDDVAAALERGHAPDLELESWPVRLVACVTACERHFEERARLGAARAVNGEVAAAQWDRLLLAARILDRLSSLPAAPRDPAGR